MGWRKSLEEAMQTLWMSFSIKLSSPRIFTSTLLLLLWVLNFSLTVSSLLDNGIKGLEWNYVKVAVVDVPHS